MYTRCPGCQAGYELTAPLMAEAAGVVRCGNCGKTFNALSQLFTHSPGDSTEPLRGSGMPPLLEHAELIQAELPVSVDEPAQAEEDASPSDPVPELKLPAASGRPWPQPLWPGISALLLIILLAQGWMLWQTPGSFLQRWGGSPAAEQIDPNELIQVMSRDMHHHPSLDDAMVVSTSLRNTGDHTIAWPVVEVRFYDGSQQLLGIRRLEPEDYLQANHRLGEGMMPGTIVPVVMEFVVGPTEPAGFGIRFF
ncbi:zinc-ribbon domain-containing protein [Wenzhouxiangella sp. AB-CW3]|uniref:DUF3426 domain-containing protein n=1 Tax=Wenzhouxiangella sp. AB-CW3 TaxID=2771012 RepID=UPI00168BD4DA|nr:DUF3426 domain-containing protein [Wenzhouxiangella sp. AB-CW3]QOC24115.1 zinc-ribbon domain-containing protein [Wenzhouxiangella sp. AB-CW3]